MADPAELRAAALDRALVACGADVDAARRAALEAWLSAVTAWNARIDLTAAHDEDDLIDLMVVDALVLARHIPQGATVVDVGSGAGAPGLALAILRPDLHLTLVEPLDKRVAFLRSSIGALQRPSSWLPIVVRGRGESLVLTRKTFDVAVSRATLPPPAWLALGARLAPSGAVWVLLAQGDAPVLAGWSAAEDLRYAWPLTSAPRRAVRFARA